MSTVTLAVHELEALLEKAKAAAEHIIHPTVEATPAAPASASASASASAVAPLPQAATPAKVAPVKAAPVARPAGVKIAGQNYASDGLTQQWVERKK
jgi:nicotinamidase-related amidase